MAPWLRLGPRGLRMFEVETPISVVICLTTVKLQLLQLLQLKAFDCPFSDSDIAESHDPRLSQTYDWHRGLPCALERTLLLQWLLLPSCSDLHHSPSGLLSKFCCLTSDRVHKLNRTVASCDMYAWGLMDYHAWDEPRPCIWMQCTFKDTSEQCSRQANCKQGLYVQDSSAMTHRTKTLHLGRAEMHGVKRNALGSRTVL